MNNTTKLYKLLNKYIICKKVKKLNLLIPTKILGTKISPPEIKNNKIFWIQNLKPPCRGVNIIKSLTSVAHNFQ